MHTFILMKIETVFKNVSTKYFPIDVNILLSKTKLTSVIAFSNSKTITIFFGNIQNLIDLWPGRDLLRDILVLEPTNIWVGGPLKLIRDAACQIITLFQVYTGYFSI